MSVHEEKSKENEQLNKIDVKNRENWDVLLLGLKYTTWKMHKKVTVFKWCKKIGNHSQYLDMLEFLFD